MLLGTGGRDGARRCKQRAECEIGIGIELAEDLTLSSIGHTKCDLAC